ncbi:hypothetical protein Ddc_13435 [Ditylenchus destructor]|nr:hypothetical protein Ddc_13435 [Ditylenchus destructor]
MRRSVALLVENKGIVDRAKEKITQAADTVKHKAQDLKEAAGQKMKDAGYDIKQGDTAETAMKAGQKMKNAGMDQAGESVKHGDTAHKAEKAGEKLKQTGEKLQKDR